MKAEWVERLHDQARTEMGFCIQAKDGNWCVRHEALKFPGEEACRVLSVAYIIAEVAGEVMGELVATDLVARASEWNDNAVPAARVRGAARIARKGAL